MSKDLDIDDDLDEIEDLTGSAVVDFVGMTSLDLCDSVISFYYLGMFKERAVMSMKELARRRDLGDDFGFELHIKDELAKLPKLDFKTPAFDITMMFKSTTTF